MFVRSWGLFLWAPAPAHACIFMVLESLLLAQHPDWGPPYPHPVCRADAAPHPPNCWAFKNVLQVVGCFPSY